MPDTKSRQKAKEAARALGHALASVAGGPSKKQGGKFTKAAAKKKKKAR